jgi:VIT1/CCC1 family predicted Fe2+/Mn2+ transporter
VDPDELPSPVMAGAASLLAFSLGALVPLLPWLLGAPYLAATLALTAVALTAVALTAVALTAVALTAVALTAVALTAVALTAVGMAVGRLTGRLVLRSGLRQLALGGLAVAVTFGVGRLIGG